MLMVFIHRHGHAHAHTHTRTHARTHARTHTRTRTHARTHAHRPTHNYTHSPRFGSRLSSKVVVCGHCLVTLSLTINQTLKWLSSLPVLMHNHSGGDSGAIGVPPPTLPSSPTSWDLGSREYLSEVNLTLSESNERRDRKQNELRTHSGLKDTDISQAMKRRTCSRPDSPILAL